jgi:serine protease AprX
VGATRNPQWGSDSRTDDTLASYSSKGPSAINRVVKPDLVAPGNMMYARIANPSTLLTQLPGNARVMDGKQYLRLSGTSMATPVVSAVAAMMIQKDPSLTPDQVKARLMKTAWKGMLPTASVYDSATATTYHIQHDLFAIGAGYLDASAALASTEKIGATKSAMSPYAKVRTDGKVEIRTDYPGTTNIVWGETSVWATNIVWGTNVLLANNLVWGENIVWGSNVAAGYNIIWGAGGVTGSSNPFMLALNAVGDN